MKSALLLAKIAVGLALACFAAAPRAHAMENTPSAPQVEKTPPPAIVVALQKATEGLLMPSETDAPFEVVFWERPKDERLTPKTLAQLAGASANAEIETRDLDEFFAPAATVEEWMNDEERAEAERFAELLEVLKTELKNPQVLVWGDAEKRVAIVGEIEQGVAGVTTLVVET